MKIPQYEQQVSISHKGDEYYHVNNNPDAWGKSFYEAREKLFESAKGFMNGLSDISDSITNSKVLEYSNFIDELDRTKLSDSENGYYSKLGKDAMRNEEDQNSGAIGVLTNIDDEIRKKQKELGLTWGKGKQMAELVRTRKMNTMYKSATAHQLQQTQAYFKTVNELAVNEAINKGMTYRNVDETREIALNNGRAAIINNARMQKWDNATTQLNLNKYESDFHSAIVQKYLNDNDLTANEYFEKNKEKILPDMQLKLQNSLRNNELKYVSKSIANDLFTMYPDNEEQAIIELDKKNLNPDEYDATKQRLTSLYSQTRRLKEQEQTQGINTFYDTAKQKIQKGEIITMDDIPEVLNGKNYINARNALESLNKTGDIKTDEETKTYLEYISNYDAQRFKGLDLSQYRLNLSNDDYKALEKRRQAIQKGDFYTVIKQESIKKYIDQITGLGEDNEKVFNQYQNMLRSFEMREGRSATNLEKEQFLKYLGSDKNNFKIIEKQIKNGNEFYNGLANNIADYQAKHNGDMPDEETVNKWIKQQSVQYYNKRYSEYFDTAVKTVSPKQNEQITLTKFADETVPQISAKIRADLKVTDRFRPQNGKYASKHSEGRACDISYTTKDGEKLSLSQKRILWKDILDNPAVEKVAVSSADKDGEFLIKTFKKDGRYRNKIQDMNVLDANGKSRDTNLGTNHTNHIHVTLYKDNTFKTKDIIALKNQFKKQGMTDEQISEYLAYKGLK